MNAIDYAEKASDIFVMSDSFIRIRELIDDESSTIDDIADVIILDPALTGSILKLANSSFFNYPGKIDTISKAVLVLGITEVYNLVIAYFTHNAFNSINADTDYLDIFWSKSVDCALLLKFLGSRLSVPNSERLFVLGLLHNLGELVVKQISPELIDRYEHIKSAELPWQKQLQTLNFTFGDCTAELLKMWQLPYTLIEPVRFQDEDDFQFSTIETKLLFIAKRIMLLNYPCHGQTAETVLPQALIAELQLEPALIADANKFCDLERLGILAILNPSASMLY